MHKFKNIGSLVYLAVMTLAMSAYAAEVRADAITFPFTGTVTAGPFAGAVGHGTFSYNPSLVVACAIPANGFFATPETGGFAVSFTIFGQTFTEADDIDYPVRPYFQITTDGVPITLDFAVSEAGNEGLLGSNGNPTLINEPGVVMFFMSNLTPALGGGFETEVSVKAVPEPTSILLMGTSLAAVAAAVRRQRKSDKGKVT